MYSSLNGDSGTLFDLSFEKIYSAKICVSTFIPHLLQIAGVPDMFQFVN